MSDPTMPDHPTVELYTRQLLDAIRPHVISADNDQVKITREGFDLLPEYNTSYPTGIADGKVWKSKTQSGLFIREYVDTGDPERVGVWTRRLVVVVDG